MLVVRGVNVFPSEVEAVVLADGRVSPHYLVVDDRRVEKRPELRVVVESAHDVADDLETRLKARLGLTCAVHVVAHGVVPRSETGKARRLARWSAGQPPVPGL